MPNTLYLNTTEQDLKQAASIIKNGGLVAFPTETVYGLGGNALDPDASKKIYAAKGRPSDNPLIVHIFDFSQVYDLALEVPESAKALAKEIWPGPMTMVFKKKSVVPDATTGGLKTVAIRMPFDKAALSLIEYSNCPIAAPSANLSGHPSPTRWQHVKEDLDQRADAIIMGNPCIGGIESTVVDMTGKYPQILRPGLITPERISEILKLPCDYDPAILGKPDPNLIPKAPGMKYKHYAPKAQMLLFSGEHKAVVKAIEEKAKEERDKGKKVEILIYFDSKNAAFSLFDDLRKADDKNADLILAETLKEDEALGFSVMNRMLKSAGYHILKV